MRKLKFALSIILILVVSSSCIKNRKAKERNSTDGTDEIITIKNDAILEEPEVTVEPEITTDSVDENIYTSADVMPEFVGGENGLIKYLKDNLNTNFNIQGRVVVRFIVDSKGDIQSPTIIRSLSSDCNNEAMRVIKEMPRWTPGKNKGKAVSVYYTLPVVFKN